MKNEGIRNSSMTNGVVLDPFLGSGSTMMACEETDRIEQDNDAVVDEVYCEVAGQAQFDAF